MEAPQKPLVIVPIVEIDGMGQTVTDEAIKLYQIVSYQKIIENHFRRFFVIARPMAVSLQNPKNGRCLRQLSAIAA